MAPDSPSVLIVDDVEANLLALEAQLAVLDCTLIRASSGNEALRQLLRRKFAVVLLDVQMPDMDGYELFRCIRSGHDNLPVVLMTAYYYDKDHVIKRSRLEGLDQVIFKKPIDPKRLKVILEQVSKREDGEA